MEALRTPALRRWTREEFEHMIASGLIQSGERVELIDGEIWTMAAHGSKHAAAVQAAQKVLEVNFGKAHLVRVQMPIVLGDWSEPEPDLAVVPGTLEDYWDHHPTKVLLVVEVADSSLKTDRTDKGSLYARGGIPDYWVLNLVDWVLEVNRDPGQDAIARYGWSYRQVQRFGIADQVSPLARPDCVIPVSSFLRQPGP